MMRGFLFLLFSFGCVCATAQKLKWDSTYRPANWDERVANFRSFPNSKKDIIFLGNSITHYTEWNELLQMPYARNRGISSDISFGVLQRLDEVTEGRPKKIFVLIGINDISRNVPDSVILQNYKRIIDRVKAESQKSILYFQSLLPVNNTFPSRNHFNKDEHIAAVNAGLELLCKNEKIGFINIHPLFLDAEKKLDKKYTYDGLHLNATGYKYWASILKPYLK
jgi:lysophospholipase L1-like esterase